MRIDNEHTEKTQRVSDLSVFDWRLAIVRPRTRGGDFVARKYRVAPSIADAVAKAAGLGEVRA
jgi:hypothetical protein